LDEKKGGEGQRGRERGKVKKREGVGWRLAIHTLSAVAVNWMRKERTWRRKGEGKGGIPPVPDKATKYLSISWYERPREY
jgi:hypothetical protein